jgi:hypothetical protein
VLLAAYIVRMGNQQCCDASDDPNQVSVKPQTVAVATFDPAPTSKGMKASPPETEVPSAEPPRWKVHVKKPADGTGVGMDINTKRYRYKYVVIRNVVPGGELDKVNETQSKDEKVKAGDRLLSANGVTGGKEIVAELKSATALDLEIQRVETEDPTSSD